jgi:hypothetical protein
MLCIWESTFNSSPVQHILGSMLLRIHNPGAYGLVYDSTPQNTKNQKP